MFFTGQTPRAHAPLRMALWKIGGNLPNGREAVRDLQGAMLLILMRRGSGKSAPEPIANDESGRFFFRFPSNLGSVFI